MAPQKPLLLRHVEGENVGRFPVWMMRQAGRYLPRYRAIREKHTFWEMATTPEIAAEVSLLPLEIMPVDGIIFFADILTMPHGLGLPIEMQEAVGPVMKAPLRSEAEFAVFRDYDPKRHTPFVSAALDLITREKPADTALLGFAGAPWTVACYLVGGRGSKSFDAILKWLHADPAGLARALSLLGDATSAYLRSQREHGAHVLQLFDTWASEMPRWFFTEHYVPLLNRIFAAAGDPMIYFPRHAHHLLADFGALDVRLLSADNLVRLTDYEARTGKRFALQGNLDPMTLFCEEGIVRREARKLVAEARKLSKPAILNLGHGILPGTPVESVKAFVAEARALWV